MRGDWSISVPALGTIDGKSVQNPLCRARNGEIMVVTYTMGFVWKICERSQIMLSCLYGKSRKGDTMTDKLSEFADACADYLAAHDGADDFETRQNAMSNPDDLWNYLWWLGGDARKICVAYEWVLATAEAVENRKCA